MVAVRDQRGDADWLTSCLCVCVCVCICHRHCTWLWWKPIGLMLIDGVPARLVIANYHPGSQLPSRSGSFLHSEEKTKLDGKFCNWCQHPPPGLHNIEDGVYFCIGGSLDGQWTVSTGHNVSHRFANHLLRPVFPKSKADDSHPLEFWKHNPAVEQTIVDWGTI